MFLWWPAGKHPPLPPSHPGPPSRSPPRPPPGRLTLSMTLWTSHQVHGGIADNGSMSAAISRVPGVHVALLGWCIADLVKSGYILTSARMLEYAAQGKNDCSDAGILYGPGHYPPDVPQRHAFWAPPSPPAPPVSPSPGAEHLLIQLISLQTCAALQKFSQQNRHCGLRSAELIA